MVKLKPTPSRDREDARAKVIFFFEVFSDAHTCRVCPIQDDRLIKFPPETNFPTDVTADPRQRQSSRVQTLYSRMVQAAISAAL
jgi:hypothetical protein